MAKITLEDVKSNVEEQGWKLLSTSYQNLNTDLEVECPAGHRLFKPYKTLRKGFICPFCLKEEKKSAQSVSLPQTDSYRILALDQATLTSGWSVWDGQTLVAHGIFQTDNDADRMARIAQMCNWLINMVNNNKPDLVLLEDIQLQDFHSNYTGNPKYDNVGITTFKVLSELLGALCVTLEQLKVPYKTVHSATWRAGVGVKGRARADKKKSAQLLVKQWYMVLVGEDEADAICIGKYGSNHYGKEVQMITWN